MLWADLGKFLPMAPCPISPALAELQRNSPQTFREALHLCWGLRGLQDRPQHQTSTDENRGYSAPTESPGTVLCPAPPHHPHHQHSTPTPWLRDGETESHAASHAPKPPALSPIPAKLCRPQGHSGDMCKVVTTTALHAHLMHGCSRPSNTAG